MGYAGADGRITEGFLHQLVRAVVIQRKHTAAGLTLEEGKEKALVASTAEVVADATAWRAVLGYLLEQIDGTLAALPTTLEQDEKAMDELDFEYDRWVQLTVRVRYKRILHTIRSNLIFRLASDVNTESSWEYEEQSWSIVYQVDTVNMRRSKALEAESLYEIELNPDVVLLATPIA
jgi:hypothetical protein